MSFKPARNDEQEQTWFRGCYLDTIFKLDTV